VNPQYIRKRHRILITAGPTREKIDPIRFISNYSTGTFGYEIAKEAKRRGLSVTLVSGPTFLNAPKGVRLIRVESASDMKRAVLKEFPKSGYVIMAAAVSDWRPRFQAKKKIKRRSARKILELAQNPDILKEIDAVTDFVREKGKLSGLLDRLAQIDKHFLRKENQLFPIIETKGITGPSKVMWALHDDIRGFIKDVRKRVEDGTMEKIATEALVKMVTGMIYKEEHILFPMMLETLSEEEWAKVRKGEEEIGFAWIKPEAQWRPVAESYQQTLLAEKVGSLNLDTGQLTADQVNLIMTHLPIDISFVNENDEVAYYSASPERIFPRSAGVIGRKVRNCHPPKSVGMVEKILSEFKAGSKNVADFWIQMKGRFVLIKYFAVRDASGKYRGCLEVSQDITEIKRLEGQC